MSKNIKYTKSFVKEFFYRNSCKLLNENYGSIYKEKMKFECKCGNISEIMFYNFKRSLRCRECGWKITSEKLSNLKRNEDYFEKINTEEKAYWLGFITADGCVEKKLRGKRYFYRFSIEITETDIGHLQKLADIFGVIVHKRDREDVHSCFITLGNKKIVEDLIDKGVVPRKTYKNCSSILDNINDKFSSDFIRGYFDGDGTVCISKKDGVEDLSTACFSICAYRNEILEKIKQIMVEGLLVNNNDIMTRKRNKNSSMFILRWGGRVQLSLIYDYLYKDSLIFLERKRKIFDKIYRHNLRLNKRKSSIFKGVSYFKLCKKWRAYIAIDRKQIHLGYYEKEVEAALAYDRFIMNHTNISRYKLNFPSSATKLYKK